MEWSDRLNSAIDYIENNLTGEIDTAIVAKKALCSDFHFQRMFSVVTGITLGEYIRRRRLTLAAAELSSGKAKVRIVALKYGYDSPEAFTRAFHQVHGVSPLTARAQGVPLVSCPRVSFLISMKGGDDIGYKIIQKPAFDLVGKVEKFTRVNIKAPSQFWVDFRQTKDIFILAKLNGAKAGPVTGGQALGVVFDVNTEDFKYGIAVEKLGETVPDGFEVIHIPASTWAVFDVNGVMPQAIWHVTNRIYGEWFPATGYKSASGIKLEVYVPDGNNYCQIWVPLKMNKDHSNFSAAQPALAPSIFQGSLNGNWAAGTYSVPGNGTFSMKIDADGIVHGSYRGDFSGIIHGQVDADGNLNATGISSSADTIPNLLKISGQLSISGNILNVTGNFKYQDYWHYFTGTGNVFSMAYYFPKRGKSKRKPEQQT
jgi:AraC family transcriptional regulator